MASGVISLRKTRAEGRRIFKNNKDNVVIVLEKWKEGLLRMDYSDRQVPTKESAKIEEIDCFILGNNDLFRYTIFYKRKKNFQFHSMMQFSITKPKCIFNYNRDKNKQLYLKIEEIL
ncbi:32225_t:CDS:2, partial [Gigaspora margarita]